MLAAFWVSWVGLLFDTAPYVLLWLVLESFLHSRSPDHVLLSMRLKLWQGVRYAFGSLWFNNWYWQLIGVSAFAVLAMVLPDNLNQLLGLAYDATYRPDTLDIASVSFLGILTLVGLLKRAFPRGGGGCDDGHCSVDGRST